MGLEMARNVLKAGIALRGYDVASPQRERFARMGGSAAKGAADAAEGCDFLLLMVVNAEQAEAALFEGGAADALSRGSVVALCSTVSPAEARALGRKLEGAGHAMIDAPVSGGKAGAEAGSLTLMASGPDEAFERAKPVFEAVSGKIHRVGSEPGMGSTYKVVHQLAAGVHLVAAAELMALGARAGCDPKKLFDIVSTSAGRSWMFEDRVPRMLDADFEPRSMVDIFIKDLGLVLETGEALSMPLPLSAAARQMLLSASALGHGRLDDSAVVKAYEAMTGGSLAEAKRGPSP